MRLIPAKEAIRVAEHAHVGSGRAAVYTGTAVGARLLAFSAVGNPCEELRLLARVNDLVEVGVSQCRHSRAPGYCAAARGDT